MYGLYFVGQTVGFSQYSSTCPAQYVVVETVFSLPPLTLCRTPADPAACPLIFHVARTPVYAGWSKVNISWIAAPLV